MKYLFLNILLALATMLGAQNEQHFEEMGQDLFYQLTAPESGRFVPLIRIKEYLQFIESQDWEKDKIIRTQNKVNQSYSQHYLEWQSSIENLQRQYAQARREGTTFEYLETRQFPVRGWEDRYEMETSFIYRSADVQSEVVLRYRMAWLPDLGLRLISVVDESF